MELDSNLINTLKSILEQKQIRRQELENNAQMIQSFNRLTYIISNVLSDSKRLKNIDLNSNDFKLLGITDDELNELKIYKIILNRELDLEPEQIARITKIFGNFNEKLTTMKQQMAYDANEYTGVCLEMFSLGDVILELESSNILSSIEISKLGKFLKENLDIDTAIELLGEYAYIMTSSYEETEQSENNMTSEIIDSVDNLNNTNEVLEREVELTKINIDDVRKLFQEFGLDFNKIIEEDKHKYQTEICLYGNLDNIKGILKEFQKYNIDLANNDLLSERSGAFAKIFTLSNPEIISKILGYIVEDLKRNNDYNNDIIYKVNKAFRIYLGAPSFFVIGNIKYATGNGKGGGSSEDNFSGNFQNFEPLRKFFLDLGVKDFNKLLSSSLSIFTSGYNTIISNFQKLISYNIPIYKIIEDSSCLQDSNAIDIIDQFIEAGFKEYIDNCLSAVHFNLNDRRLIQMINAKKLGWDNEGAYGEKAVFRKQNRGSSSRLIRQDKMLSTLKSDNLIEEPIYESESVEFPLDLKNVYGISDDILENEYIIRLEEMFKTSEYTYNFNEIIISRYKVLRYFGYLIHNGFGTFENLKNIIFKNKILTKTEYDLVMSLLEEKVKNTGEQL